FSGFVDLFTNGTISADTVTGDGPFFLYAGGLAQFTGVISAPQIFVNSSDIDIVTDASLGVTGLTQLIALNSINDGPMYIGANLTPTPGAYVLNEDGDIHAQAITVNALTASDGPSPDIIIGDVH